MKVLVAEDDEDSRHLLEAILAANDYQVVSFANGLNALAYLQTESVDLIISDVVMPIMDGYGLCRAIKQNLRLQNIPFIFYTAIYIAPEDKQFALSLGADKVLIKPMLIPEFLGVIAETLAQTDANATGGRHPNGQEAPGLGCLLNDGICLGVDRKVIQLHEENLELAERETRFRDFAEASADWFWEADQDFNVTAWFGQKADFTCAHLFDLAQALHNRQPSEMLKRLYDHQRFADFIARMDQQNSKPVFLRVSGKPVFAQDGNFHGYRGIACDVTEMMALAHRLEYLSTYDGLTGLPNSILLKQHLDQALVRAKASARQLLVLHFGLDHFQAVNDHLGHEAGDQLLVLATQHLAEHLRGGLDTLFRLGGDEFVMVLEAISPEQVYPLLGDILATFDKPFLVLQQAFCSVSIGVSVYPDDTVNPQTLLAYADLAMFRAKHNGRQGFEFYSDALNAAAHQWLDTMKRIRQALEDGQFLLMFQPQFAIEHRYLTGLEGLLRWRHPEQGLVSPLEFMKVAGQCGLINAVDEWMLTACCRQIRAWLDLGFKAPRVAVNISTRCLLAESFVQRLLSLPAEYRIPAGGLCLEITDQALLLEKTEAMRQAISQIKNAGFAVALGDFGTGRLLLSDLKYWAVDEVKIASCFLEDLADNQENQAIIKAILGLCAALDVKVAVKGVETTAQAQALAGIGCEKAQGNYFSPPLMPDEVIAWLTQ